MHLRQALAASSEGEQLLEGFRAFRGMRMNAYSRSSSRQKQKFKPWKRKMQGVKKAKANYQSPTEQRMRSRF
eukprot:scaffold53938_cov29-Prasinocladus_malaysianus.AAC.1